MHWLRSALGIFDQSFSSSLRPFLAGQATFNSSPLATTRNQVNRRAARRLYVIAGHRIGHVDYEAKANQKR
jgi:hypothetical protein